MESIEPYESARRHLQDVLDRAKTQAERNRMGQFATPPALARDIVQIAASLLPPDAAIRFLDPGFGTGSFYSALRGLLPEGQVAAADGYEIDPHYGSEAQRLWRDTELRLQIADFTQAVPSRSPSARANLVICNPPYVRHHHLPADRKVELQRIAHQCCGVKPNGLSGLYCYFLCIAHGWMAEEGIAAWLIPSEFMDVNYGEQIKRYLLDKVTLLRIHRFDPSEVQFDDALVSSAVVFFRKAPPADAHVVEFSFGGTLDSPAITNRVAAAALRNERKWTRFPELKPRPDAPLDGGTLADLFVTRRGIATGCNSFFILTPEKVSELAIPPELVKPIFPSPRYLETDEVPADASGDPMIERRRYLLDCDLPPEAIRSRHPRLWDYLESGIAQGVRERYLCTRREPWYTQERRAPAPFLCTYMGRAGGRGTTPFRFILNHSRAIAPNVYLMLYPKPALAKALADDSELPRAVWRALGSLTAEMLLGEGRVYGGGLHKLEPKELANVSADLVLSVLPAARQPPRQRVLFAG